MSISPYFYVEKYNRDTGAWELVAPYVWNDDKTELVQADLWPYNGTHDLFSILTGEHNLFPEFDSIRRGMPVDACGEIKEVYSKYEKDSNGDCWWQPQVFYFTHAEMIIYLLKNPQVKDYDTIDDGGGAMTDNPLKELKDRVDMFLEIADPFWFGRYYSDVRIVFWLSR